ncbi:DUF2812 domain-containing protein [Bacillus subtilis]|uniref:DUF2812 domain-containing protein n=1 Tax=Bacillus subtilis TaxID=1423 RepID=UPI00397EB59D
MDIDSEEQWLNKMADKGCELKGKVFLSYCFSDETSSDNSTVKIDYRTFRACQEKCVSYSRYFFTRSFRWS